MVVHGLVVAGSEAPVLPQFHEPIVIGLAGLVEVGAIGSRAFAAWVWRDHCPCSHVRDAFTDMTEVLHHLAQLCLHAKANHFGAREVVRSNLTIAKKNILTMATCILYKLFYLCIYN